MEDNCLFFAVSVVVNEGPSQYLLAFNELIASSCILWIAHTFEQMKTLKRYQKF